MVIFRHEQKAPGKLRLTDPKQIIMNLCFYQCGAYLVKIPQDCTSLILFRRRFYCITPGDRVGDDDVLSFLVIFLRNISFAKSTPCAVATGFFRSTTWLNRFE